MSDHAAQNQAEPSFAELLRETPREQGTVTVVGVLSHATQEGRFVLIGASGETVEIPVEAVKHHHVVRRIPARVVVQVELDAARLENAIPKTLADKARKDPLFDGKPSFGDHGGGKVPILDVGRPGEGGEGDPAQLSREIAAVYPGKPATKDPLYDRHGHGYQKLLHEGVAAPWRPGTVPVMPGGGGWPPPKLWQDPQKAWLDPKHPWMDKPPAFDVVVNPPSYAEGPYAAGAVPFVLATPHHAPQAVAYTADLPKWPAGS